MLEKEYSQSKTHSTTKYSNVTDNNSNNNLLNAPNNNNKYTLPAKNIAKSTKNNDIIKKIFDK